MTFRNFMWLLLLAVLWGPSFLFIKVAVQEIPPITLANLRVGIAALILYVILRAKGRKLPRSREMWRHFITAGFFANALPFALFSWGEIYVDSALASILNGTTPLFTIIFAHFFIPEDRINPPKLLGTLIGFVGLVLLVGPSFLQGAESTFWGLLAIIGAAVCYGISIVYIKIHMATLPPFVAPTGQLLTATLILLPLSIFIENPFVMPLPSWQATSSLLALAVFGTAIAFIVYYHIVDSSSATHLSMITYLVPIFGIFLGVVFLNEKIGWTAYIGCLFILMGVMVANGVLKRLYSQ